MIKKAILKYEEKEILNARYYHKKSNDYLRYKAIVLIKESGKKPVEIHLKFDGIYPFVAPMPPEEGGGPHCLDSLMGGISSESVVYFFIKHQAASANG
jgi:hypothetical protein